MVRRMSSPSTAAEVELTPLRLVVAGPADASPEALWTTFVQRQQPVLRATARRITGDVVMADDAVQETLIAFWRHASRLDVQDAAQVQAWLLRVAANAARRQLRRAVTITDTPTEALAVLPAHEPMEPPALAGLRRHLAGLPEIHRRVLELRFLDQRSYDEIATALGVNEAAARKRVDRALVELRLRLRRDGVAVPAVQALASSSNNRWTSRCRS
jgi:RNA polymerase sigma-70 factor (ECF subfamily)